MKFAIVLILLFLILLFTDFAAAQDFPSFGSGEKGNPFSISLDHTDIPTTGGLMGSALNEQRGQINFPLYTGVENYWSANLRGGRVQIAEALTIEDQNMPIPQEFGSGDIGVSWRTVNLAGETTSASASIGSSGRKLLDNSNSRVISANFLTEFKTAEGNTWVVLVNYSNNRTFLNNVPLPGVAYVINKPYGTFVIGAPFIFISYRPMPIMMTTVLSPFVVSAEVSWFFLGPFQLFSGASWTPRAYQNLVPDTNDNRLFYEKKEWVSGIKAPIAKGTSVTAGYVYAFNRRFFMGKSVTQVNSSSTLLNDAGGFQVRFKTRF